jgi:23S rRNA (guanine2445-N2)-methyltransferase / 23S rRNA (guanine2069-N7)-methyltransferase
LIICNPPYGERLGEKASLSYLYQQLGEAMAREFEGWQAAVFTADLDLGRAIGLRSHKRYTLWNGALESSLLLFELKDNAFRPSVAARSQSAAAPTSEQELSEGASMFGNRIRKNRKRLASWVKREGVSCYRLYDADMPEYAVAVDIYDGHAHVAEYRAPKDVAEEAAARRLAEIAAALPGALAMPEDRIVYKQRSRQRGAGQYQKQDSRGELLAVREGQVKLLVNLHDYIDTGLFLDHRPLRLRLAAESPGKDFLNLFCYTGSATVHAAMAGARSTTSVDTSNTYLAWLRKNLAANGLAESRNHVVRADCRDWLDENEQQFDLIMLDPPSFSNTSGAAADFDVQRDHVALVASAMQRLRRGGSLYFSNNRRGFKLGPQVEQDFDCTDITRQTLDPDFQRNARIHQCWQIRHP